MSGAERVTFGELFDGEPWDIDPDEDLTPVTWAVSDEDWVPVEASERDPLEGPTWNWVLRDLEPWEVRAYGIENGWSTLSVMSQEIGKLLGGEVKAAQYRQSRDEAGNKTAISSKFKLQYVPGRHGWRGKEL